MRNAIYGPTFMNMIMNLNEFKLKKEIIQWRSCSVSLQILCLNLFCSSVPSELGYQRNLIGL